MSNWPVKKILLDAPLLQELAPILSTSLRSNFKDVSVAVATCPDLRLPPFHLAAAGLSGNERIADIGGPPFLHPLPRFDKYYSLLGLTKQMEMTPERGFVLGAGAGPWKEVGVNSELVPNLSYEMGIDGEVKVVNGSYVAKISTSDDEEGKGGVGKCICESVGKIGGNSTDCALMANLFGSEGRTGEVLHIAVKTRTGSLDFISSIQDALKNEYGNRHVSMGGVFLIKKGKANLHVMPDFSTEPMGSDDVKGWLRFFEMSAPLICCTVFHSVDPGLELRMEHTHCFSQHGEGGHYHADTTPEEVEYEAYLNTAKVLYRIDQPEGIWGI